MNEVRPEAGILLRTFGLRTLLLCVSSVLCLSTAARGQEGELRELDIDLSDVRYPYPVSFLNLNVQGQPLRMAYMDVRPQNYNGKNVLLLHGKNFNGAYWETTVRALAEKGYRVVVPDQIGFGKSSKPEHFQYSFHQLAANTKGLLDTLGVDRTAVLGHSMGGMLATRFVLMYPEVTERLVLENPIGLEDYKRIVPYRPVEWWYENELKQSHESIKEYQRRNYYDGKWKPEYDRWVNLLAGWTLNDRYPLIAWNSALTYDMIVTQPVLYEFPDIAVPTLLIIGTRDRTALGKPLVPEDVRAAMGRYDRLGRATRDRIPGATLAELEDVGHLPHIEAFDRFIAPLLSFLAE